MKKKKLGALAAVAMCAVLGLSGLAGCESSDGSSSASTSTSSSAQTKTLEGKTLNIYCGAGMTDPFQKIADEFKTETGCEMVITFANAAQIQTQIKTTEEGDFFIAGSKEETKPVEEYVTSSTDLVKHIHVLVVPKDNPKNIASLNDLVNADTILIGDPESTPIGKIAKKAFTDAGIFDAVSGKLTTTTTAPQIAAALARGEGDAGIVWKENVKADGATIVADSGMDSYTKVIPAAQLKSVKDAEAAAAFLEFLGSDTAKSIWAEYGYEQA